MFKNLGNLDLEVPLLSSSLCIDCTNELLSLESDPSSDTKCADWLFAWSARSSFTSSRSVRLLATSSHSLHVCGLCLSWLWLWLTLLLLLLVGLWDSSTILRNRCRLWNIPSEFQHNLIGFVVWFFLWPACVSFKIFFCKGEFLVFGSECLSLRIRHHWLEKQMQNTKQE